MFEGWLTSRAAQRQDRPGCSPAPLPHDGDRRQPGRQQDLSTSRLAMTRSVLLGRTRA